MENKNNKLIKEKALDVNTKILITIFLLFCFQNSFSIDISIWPKEIKFNYEAGYSNDALTLKEDAGSYIPVPEWIKDVRGEKCAYFKGQSNRKIQVKFDSNSDNMNCLIKATVISGQGIGTVCEAFVAECDLDENKWITLDLTGSLPNSVGKRTFQWKWEATALPINSPYCPIVCEPCTTEHTFYTLLDVPQAPMEEPWIEVLNYACNKASGQTTTSGVISSLTETLYYNSGIKYSPTSNYVYYYWYDNLDLTSLLWDLITDPNNMEMDCRDFANFLHVLTNALGVTGGYNRIGYNFTHNYILPAEWSSKKNPENWVYHMVGWFNSKVADASLQIDNDDDPTSSPFEWKLAVGDMTLLEYLDKLTEDSAGSVATGVCTVY